MHPTVGQVLRQHRSTRFASIRNGSLQSEAGAAKHTKVGVLKSTGRFEQKRFASKRSGSLQTETGAAKHTKKVSVLRSPGRFEQKRFASNRNGSLRTETGAAEQIRYGCLRSVLCEHRLLLLLAR